MFNTFSGKSLPGSSTKQARFIAGSGSWPIPANLVGDFVMLTLVAAGGGGGFNIGAGDGGSGGGAGETIYRFPFFINPLVNSSIAYSVGAAGVGAPTGATANGNDGGDSTFDILSCEGGKAGAGIGSGGDGGGLQGGAGGTTGVDGGDGALTISGELYYRFGGAGGGEGKENVNTPSDGGDSPLFGGGNNQWTAGELSGPGGGGFEPGGYQPGAGALFAPSFGGGGAGGLGTGPVAGQDGGSGLILIEYQVG